MPSGINWTSEEENALWSEWKKQPEGIRPKFFATQYAKKGNRTANSINGKLQELIKREESGVPVSNYGSWDNPPILDGDAFVLMDAHFPLHDAEFINKCLAVCKKWKINKAILGGDAFDANSFNMHPDNFEAEDKRILDSRLRKELMAFSEGLTAEQRFKLQDMVSRSETEDGNIPEEFRETRKCLKPFELYFDNILWIMGNHEQRILRILTKTLGVDTVALLLHVDNPKWILSPYYWAILKSGGIEWQIEHPINSGKGSSKKLASKFTTNIIMGHGHHVSMVTDPSGKFLAIEPGAGADEERMGYVSQRHNSADKHGLGAVIVRNGRAHLLNEFTDWDFLMSFKG